MEKHKPGYLLSEIKELLNSEKSRIITRSSRNNAVSLGYADEEAMVARVQELKRTEFYKSMTSHNNSRLWQDVYKTSDGDIALYIKLQISADGKGVIISFKRATEEEYSNV